LEEISALPNVTVDMPKREGNNTRYLSSLGVIRIAAKDADELCSRLGLINSRLKVTDTEGNNLIIYYDDFETLKTEYEFGLKEWEA